jgi:hypothetical protein
LGADGSGAGGIGTSPAEVVPVMAKTSNRANTKFLTDFIDLLLKNVVVKAGEVVCNQRDLLVGLDNIRQLKGLQGSLPIKKLET